MKKILMLGFEPFGHDSINPALEAIKVLDNKELKEDVIITPPFNSLLSSTFIASSAGFIES